MNYSDDEIIEKACEILAKRIKKSQVTIDNMKAACSFLTLRLAEEEREIFGVIWLNAKHEIIEAEDLFFGTLMHTPVYPREVIKRGLKHNAAACIVYHNHPSGNNKPSVADEELTATLTKVLHMVDIKLLDHIIVGGLSTASFAEMGLIV